MIGKDKMINIQIDSILIRKDKIVEIVNITLFSSKQSLSLDAKTKIRLDNETETVKILADVQVGEIENQLTNVSADIAQIMKVIKFLFLLEFIEIIPKITENESVIEIKRNTE